MVGACVTLAVVFDTFLVLVLGFQVSLLPVPGDAELAHETPCRLLPLCPPLTPWLLAASSELCFLLRLLPHLLPPLKGVEAGPGSHFTAFFAYGCSQPAALRASSSGLRTLVLLTGTGFFKVGQAFLCSLRISFKGSSRRPCAFSSCFHWGLGTGVPQTGQEGTWRAPIPPLLKVLLPDTSWGICLLMSHILGWLSTFPEVGVTFGFLLVSWAYLLES